MKRFFRILLTLVLVACIAYSAYKIYEISAEYDKAEEVNVAMHVYHPEPLPAPTPDPETPPPTAEASKPPGISRPNPSIVDAQNEINPDIVGWLTVPGTVIDYLFVHSADNSDYLKRDLNGNHNSSGSIFMDCRNSLDFSDFNTIIYGHNMKSGKMFHNLRYFGEERVFDANRTGTIYLVDKTFTLHFFAYLMVDAGNSWVYDTLQIGDETDLKNYMDYVKRNARRYREPNLAFGDQIVTLSTCAYEFEGSRMVLLAKLEEEYM